MNVTYPEPPMDIDVYRYIDRLKDDSVIREASTRVTVKPNGDSTVRIEEAGNAGLEIDDSQIPPQMVGDGSEIVKRAQDIAWEMFGHRYEATVYEDDQCSRTDIRIWSDWWQRAHGQTGPLAQFVDSNAGEA